MEALLDWAPTYPFAVIAVVLICAFGPKIFRHVHTRLLRKSGWQSAAAVLSDLELTEPEARALYQAAGFTPRARIVGGAVYLDGESIAKLTAAQEDRSPSLIRQRQSSLEAIGLATGASTLAATLVAAFVKPADPSPYSAAGDEASPELSAQRSRREKTERQLVIWYNRMRVAHATSSFFIRVRPRRPSALEWCEIWVEPDHSVRFVAHGHPRDWLVTLLHRAGLGGDEITSALNEVPVPGPAARDAVRRLLRWHDQYDFSGAYADSWIDE